MRSFYSEMRQGLKPPQPSATEQLVQSMYVPMRHRTLSVVLGGIIYGYVPQFPQDFHRTFINWKLYHEEAARRAQKAAKKRKDRGSYARSEAGSSDPSSEG